IRSYQRCVEGIVTTRTAATSKRTNAVQWPVTNCFPPANQAMPKAIANQNMSVKTLVNQSRPKVVFCSAATSVSSSAVVSVGFSFSASSFGSVELLFIDFLQE